MCGIAGVIAWDENFRVSRETLECMSAASPIAGPMEPASGEQTAAEWATVDDGSGERQRASPGCIC